MLYLKMGLNMIDYFFLRLGVSINFVSSIKKCIEGATLGRVVIRIFSSGDLCSVVPSGFLPLLNETINNNK